MIWSVNISRSRQLLHQYTFTHFPNESAQAYNHGMSLLFVQKISKSSANHQRLYDCRKVWLQQLTLDLIVVKICNWLLIDAERSAQYQPRKKSTVDGVVIRQFVTSIRSRTKQNRLIVERSSWEYWQLKPGAPKNSIQRTMNPKANLAYFTPRSRSSWQCMCFCLLFCLLKRQTHFNF